MTEDDARAWMTGRFGEDATARVAAFVARVIDENGCQNLIAPSTIATIWTRHVVDSAQLLALAPALATPGSGPGRGSGPWLDIGTGGGFPGFVVALLTTAPVTLVEPRKRRAAFLDACVRDFGLSAQVQVEASKVEQVAGDYAVISARAVATIGNLLRSAQHCATVETRWLLPRGRIGDGEMEAIRRNWRGVFHVEHSVTDPESLILVIDRVQSR